MPGRPSDSGDSLVPFSPEAVGPVAHRVACIRPPPPDSETLDGTGAEGPEEEIGGKVVEVKLGNGEGEVSEAERRRIAYGSVAPFALLQSQKNLFAASSRMPNSSIRTEWWHHVLEYSNRISNLLGERKPLPSAVIEDPKMILQPGEEPKSLKAAWQLMEIFYVDKQFSSWLPECLVDWLADYDSLLTRTESTIHTKISSLQKKLDSLKVKLLRLHGSYQLDQLDSREIENGLVEAVAVLVSTMPRMRPDLPPGRLGQCCKTKQEYIKAWEKWRGHVSKLESSAFWVQCSHPETRDGLRNLLQIMLGNIKNLTVATCHWMELFISHFLYIRPFTVGLEGMQNLAQKCMQLKPSSNYNGLIRLLTGIFGENPEVVLAECSKSFGSWMVVHAMELLTASSDNFGILLHEERYNLGGISIEELYRLGYAQVLSSHPLTWQIAPTYLASCPKQGLGLLEILLYRQPVQNYQLVLKTLEICRLYELENISSSIMKIAGMCQWKHGRKGSGIAQQLFESIGKSVSDDSFKQWEGLIELLGSDVGTAGGLEFLYKYRDFKRSLHLALEGRAVDAARQTMQSLIQLMRNPSTPQRFWLPLLHDSVTLLNWKPQPLLNVAETNLLLNKLQELSMAKLRPDYCDTNLPPQALSSVRLALAANLGRAILEEC
uniref:Nuclear pore complex protein Nup85 n=1 Tax=Ananas comosus var. bracteatus TaxID=296719 RepID=A0A6V7NZZ5_ANACO|nr:unnamed protein product [Ananas comosus var. bracteatus]